MRLPLPLLLLTLACASSDPVSTVQRYRDAHARGDRVAEAAMLAADARIWFEKREGAGDPLTPNGGGRYAHWDRFFRSSSTATGWRASNGTVSAVIQETNDFYRLLDWKPNPYRMTWWLDDRGRITGALVESIPAKTESRMNEFKEWAKANAPDELAYLMPGGRIDPTGDRPERFAALLTRWRAAAGLPAVSR